MGDPPGSRAVRLDRRGSAARSRPNLARGSQANLVAAREYDLCCLLAPSWPTAQWRRPFRREARPPRVRVVTFPATPPDLRCRALIAEALRSCARSPRPVSASYPVPVCQLAVPLPASFSAGLATRSLSVFALRFARSPCDLVPQRTYTSVSRPCRAHAKAARSCDRAALVVGAEKIADQDQVPGARDGQELGDALDDAEDQCVNEVSH